VRGLLNELARGMTREIMISNGEVYFIERNLCIRTGLGVQLIARPYALYSPY
jgi:hypothetical protein